MGLSDVRKLRCRLTSSSGVPYVDLCTLVEGKSFFKVCDVRDVRVQTEIGRLEVAILDFDKYLHYIGKVEANDIKPSTLVGVYVSIPTRWRARKRGVPR